MKKILYLLLVIFTLGLFAVGCQSDKQNAPSELRQNQLRKAKQKKANQQKKANRQKEAKSAALPLISQLQKSEKQTHAFIKRINDKNPAIDKPPFRLTGNTITIKGMAIDKPLRTAAAGVYVKIGDQFFKTDYGQSQRAYAERAKNLKYLKSAFTVTIPTHKIKQGDYDVSLCVVSSDRKTYYESAKKVKVQLK